MIDATMPPVTKSEFARQLGVAKSYVSKLAEMGRLVLTPEGLVDAEASQRRIQETADPSKRTSIGTENAQQRAETSAQGDKIGNSYQAARAVKERYYALEAKRAYEVASGQLLRADEVHAAIADHATTLRTRLENLPDQLAVQMGPHTDEAQRRAIAADLIETVLDNLAAEFSKIAKANPHAPT